jgi:Bacterial Ig domain/Fibronectin type III domain
VLLGLDYGINGIASYLPASSIGSQPTIFMHFKVSVKTNQPSPPPVMIQANLHAYTTPSEILLTWDAVPGAVHYELYRAGADLAWKLASSAVTTTRFRDGDYDWFPTYYRIIAVTFAGERFVSETVTAPNPYLLVQLSGISVRPLSETSVSIDWEVNHPLRNQSGPPPSGGARALLEVGSSPSDLAPVEWSATYAESGHHVLANLAPATTYWYRLTIIGVNDSGFTYLNSFVTRPAPEIQHAVVSVPDVSAGLTTIEDTPIAFTLTTDEPHDPPMIFTITTQPNHGIITGASPEFLYTPSPDWDGFDVFWYSATDGFSTISGVVIVTLVPVNDAPVAVEPFLAVVDDDSSAGLPLEGFELDAGVVGVAGFTIVSGPTNGTMQAGTYTPKPNFNGIDHLTYRASDGEIEGNLATVRIRVFPINDPPTARDQSVSVLRDTPQTVSLLASDPDEQLLSLFIGTPPVHGTLSARGIAVFDLTICHGLSDLIYTPNPGYTGADRFEYVVMDGSAAAWGSVSIQVISPNHAPQAIGQSVVTEFGVAVPVLLSGIDPDGDSLGYSAVNPPPHGTLSGTPPQLVYTPAPGFAGSDSFSFAVDDGSLTSTPALVAVTVLAADATPLAPSGLIAVATSDHLINLSWVDRSSYEKGFRIERSADGGIFKQIASVNPNVVTYSDGGVQTGKTYSYRVRAYNKQGNSTYSNTVSATP